MSSFGPAVAVGLAADAVVGEPPAAVHPVAWFGRAMQRLERSVYRDSCGTGVVFWTIGVSSASIVGWGLARLIGPQRATVLATTLAVAPRMLAGEAQRIGALLDGGDLDGARQQLPALVGRSPAGLDANEIARAVIESVAENAVDAMVAPAMWAAVGGAPAVLAYRAINTLDAMVGHRSERYERFGWASARADDVANWLPARYAAVLVAVIRPGAAREVGRVVRRDAAQHPSPNGGVIEAAFAAALGVRLGGSNRYGDIVEDRGVLGDGAMPEASDIAAAVRLLRHLTVAVGASMCAATAIGRTRALRRYLPLQFRHATSSR